MPRNTGHEANGQEHRYNREGGRNHGKANFVGSINRRLIGRFAHAHVPDDVFDFHNSVIHQNPGHKAKREQRHGVEREAQQV